MILDEHHKSFQKVAETHGHVMNLLLIWKAKVVKSPLDLSELHIPIMVKKAKNILYSGAIHLTKYSLAASAVQVVCYKSENSFILMGNQPHKGRFHQG